jgi:hypothetical protein
MRNLNGFETQVDSHSKAIYVVQMRRNTLLRWGEPEYKQSLCYPKEAVVLKWSLVSLSVEGSLQLTIASRQWSVIVSNRSGARRCNTGTPLYPKDIEQTSGSEKCHDLRC